MSKRPTVEGAYQSQTKSSFGQYERYASIDQTTKGRSNLSKGSTLFGGANGGNRPGSQYRPQIQPSSHRDGYHTINRSFSGHSSSRGMRNTGPRRVKSANKRASTDQVNSNYINNVDLRYNSKSTWHNQGPLSHAILISEKPDKIRSKDSFLCKNSPKSNYFD